MKSFIGLFILLVASGQSLAEGKNIGLQYSLAASSFFGDLSTNKTQWTHDFQLTFFHFNSADWPLEYYVAIDTLFTDAQNTGNKFSYPTDSRIRILAFLFIVNICSKDLTPINFCVGLGQGTVNANTVPEQRDWGTWNYQLLAKYTLKPEFSIHALAKYVGRVEQVVNTQYAYFSFISWGLGGEYLF
jgi:hypothetical protein